MRTKKERDISKLFDLRISALKKIHNSLCDFHEEVKKSILNHETKISLIKQFEPSNFCDINDDDAFDEICGIYDELLGIK